MNTHTTSAALSQWKVAMERLENAEADYRRYDTEVWRPLYEKQEWFERQHGLIPPGCGRTATPNYFERRRALAKQYSYLVPDSINDEAERLSTAVADAESALMNLAAPDSAALLWKLDKVLEIEGPEDEDGGSTPCWSEHYVRQTIKDYRRILSKAEGVLA